MIAAAVKALAGWRGYAAAVLLGAGAAWFILDAFHGRELAERERDQAEHVADAQRAAREILQRRYAAVTEINERNARAEWAAYGGLRSAQIEDDGFRADVDAGRQRLHVAAACPAASGGVPRSGAGAGMGNGARAELDPAARSDYFALRAGIQRITAQLQACQARLR
ncbi:lysis system i-spanin subunit Rz [Achromobacter insolitus]|uniref:lysis system i-spanin subunit Rz n=1 Tax=Achromobacter insolitus TaxID=217204 RepID=UPI0028AB32C2|nr:lysis system i-spanin subunit Rz [Achromobacter insolitus]